MAQWSEQLLNSGGSNLDTKLNTTKNQWINGKSKKSETTLKQIKIKQKVQKSRNRIGNSKRN